MRKWGIHIVLLCLTLSGLAQDTVDFNLYGSFTSEFGVDMHIMQDSTILIVGNSGDNSQNDDAGVVVINVNDSGKVNWTKTITSRASDNVTASALENDSTLWVSGISNAYHPNYRGFIVRANLNDSTDKKEWFFDLDGDWSVSDQIAIHQDYAYFTVRSLTDLAKNLRIYRMSTVDFDMTFTELDSTPSYEVHQIAFDTNNDLTLTGSILGDSLDALILMLDGTSLGANNRIVYSTSGDDVFYDTEVFTDTSIISIGYTTGHFGNDEDILVVVHALNGNIVKEQIRGHSSTVENKNDRGYSVFLRGDTVHLSGFTETYGEGKDIFLSHANTGLFDYTGSTTAGESGEDVCLAHKPWKNGVIGVGYSSSESQGLEDILFLNRWEFQASQTTINFNPVLVETVPWIIFSTNDLRQPDELSVIRTLEYTEVQFKDFRPFSYSIYDLTGRLIKVGTNTVLNIVPDAPYFISIGEGEETFWIKTLGIE